jgi:hypothetical protein
VLLVELSEASQQQNMSARCSQEVTAVSHVLRYIVSTPDLACPYTLVPMTVTKCCQTASMTSPVHVCAACVHADLQATQGEAGPDCGSVTRAADQEACTHGT